MWYKYQYASIEINNIFFAFRVLTENVNNDKVVDKETKIVNNPITSTPKSSQKQNAHNLKSSQTFW